MTLPSTNKNVCVSSLSDRDLDLGAVHWDDQRIKADSFLIEHLREIERRKLYCDFGYSTLSKYCTKRLKLSDGAAQRRIEVVRLTNTLPELKEKIHSGEMSLSVAAQTQSFIRQEGNLTELSLDAK